MDFVFRHGRIGYTLPQYAIRVMAMPSQKSRRSNTLAL
jgi:hypothetical protein